MKIEKSAKEVGQFKIFIGILLALMFLFFHWVFINFFADGHFVPGRGWVRSPDWLTTTFICIYSLIAVVVVAFFVSQGIGLIRTGGQWEITVDGSGINWLSPSQKIDASFFLPFDEIDYIGTKQRFESHRRGSDRDFIKVIVKKDGSLFDFTNECCVDLELIYNELEALGIPYRDSKLPYEYSSNQSEL